MNCDRCEMVSINGAACHEIGCPNAGSRWDDGVWIKQRECPECGQTVDADDLCCDGDDDERDAERERACEEADAAERGHGEG